MATNREIERKFLVAQRPAGWQRRPSTSIAQGYLRLATQGLEIRLRQRARKSFLTIKGGYGLNRLEVEIEIPEAKFRALWSLTAGARISKRRYLIPFRGHTIEMDVYEGPHRGLVTADVEFTSERASRAFVPPPWLGREITGQRRYGNQVLARLGGLPRGLSLA